MGLRTFTFGGKSSSAYSMFITEAATYNVPERAVEMLEIPGRNGAYALDQGRFENVEVTYHVVVHKDTNANFQTELSNVRNWLASKVGYQRLTDDYNSSVYRMAIFKGGLETSEAFVNGAEFDIVFECKPQRWLTSGETATAVADEGTLTNPTLFDASPLLEVKGYGNIAFNGYSIDIKNELLGNVYYSLTEDPSSSYYTKKTLISDGRLNSYDKIRINNLRLKNVFTFPDGYNITDLTAAVTPSSTFVGDYHSDFNGKSFWVDISSYFRSFVVEYVANFSYAYQVTGSVTYTDDGGTSYTKSYVCNFLVSVTPSSPYYLKFRTVMLVDGTDYAVSSISYDSIYGISTKSALGNPTYIDCDTGECYLINSDEIVGLNHLISLGSDLPILSANSTTTFDYDNTITELKVTPRWWKV